LYEESNGDSEIYKLIKEFFSSQDKFALLHLLCYQKSLVNAARAHPLEQEDFDIWISQIDALLLEIFKTKSLDNTDHLLQLLLPTLNLSKYDKLEQKIQSNIKKLSSMDIDHKRETALGLESKMDSAKDSIENMVDELRKEQDDFMKLHKSWSLAHFEKISVLSYCVSKDLKLLFQCSQVSGIIESVFYSALIPNKISLEYAEKYSICHFSLSMIRNNERRKSAFLFIGKILNYSSLIYPELLDTITSSEEFKIINAISIIENLRYCPVAMFTAELVSKLVMIGLVAYISLHCKTTADICEASEPEVYIIFMVCANIIYEVGKLNL
jgi:FtsZ-binding cell division protein ZapB